MDIRRDAFWGHLTLNGRNVLLNGNMWTKGSVMSLVAESLKSLVNEKSRLTADGEQEIVLRIRNSPTSTDTLQLGRIEEVEALLGDGDGDVPHEGETYEEFFHRLLESDYPAASAEYIAAQWFKRPVNPATTSWLNDPKAIRFRVLNSRDEEFEAALAKRIRVAQELRQEHVSRFHR
jgi:hypothetical protein